MPFFKRCCNKEKHQTYRRHDRYRDRGIISRRDHNEVVHYVILIEKVSDNVRHKRGINGQKQRQKRKPLAGEEGLEPDLGAVGRQRHRVADEDRYREDQKVEREHSRDDEAQGIRRRCGLQRIREKLCIAVVGRRVKGADALYCLRDHFVDRLQAVELIAVIKADAADEAGEPRKERKYRGGAIFQPDESPLGSMSFPRLLRDISYSRHDYLPSGIPSRKYAASISATDSANASGNISSAFPTVPLSSGPEKPM